MKQKYFHLIIVVMLLGATVAQDWRLRGALLLIAGAAIFAHCRAAQRVTAAMLENPRLLEERQAALSEQLQRFEQVARALRESEKRFHAVISNHADGILVADMRSIIRFINPAARALFDLPEDALIGKKFAIPVMEDEPTEFELPKRDGSTSIVEIRTVKIEWENEPAYLESLRDITHHKMTEDALRDSQERLQDSYQREQKRRQLSDTLRDVTRIVSSTLHQDTVIRMILTQLESVVAYDRVTVMLLTEHEELTVVAGRDTIGDDEETATMPVSKYPLNEAILQHKQPICVPDVAHDPRWRATPATQGMRSFIGAPLLVQETPIGLVTVGRRSHAPYSDDDAQTVFAFATQVAIAIYNARLHADTEERNRRLALLHEISLAVNSTLDLPALLTAACRKFVENFGADHSGIVLLDSARTFGEVKAEYPPQQAVGIRMPLAGYALMADMLETQQPYAIDDARHDARMQAVSGVMQVLGIQSILIIPLISKGQVIGSFSLDMMTRPRHFTPQEMALAQTIAAQLANAIENARLLEQERKRLEDELETARQIQTSLFPPEAPVFAGLEIVGMSCPAKKVGGDFYNYFSHDRQQVGIAVGDVSGKGIQAALMMALSCGLLSLEARRETSPSLLLSKINADLRPHTQRNKKNTAMSYLAAEYQAEGGAPRWKLRVANAGCITPLLRRRDGSVHWIDASGLPLGMVSGIRYVERQDELCAGDALVLSSDGLVEAMNATGELYGFERVEAALASAPADSARAVQEYLLADVHAFAGEREFHDDITLVVLFVPNQ